ncbi:uncharacterized protein MELLADRAFT_111414 [Melampsora larici-populina 98AG31]|uniref:Syntaxin 6/10/61 N-terminal domain-containing protein n=1 Tax=Melampsora larici-populina (strain 98AG31 / pathotype 3-4-7) TaxID=747676 RepID=F4S347_MELLP|nr:uncharacterized protein MELLADRAFT_111414 [Melampsora larici-populina 98AG31]EGG00920.1 hypothetical protein MELLADRAFT_111414 [Melampsora larici-populina 98AG31]
MSKDPYFEVKSTKSELNATLSGLMADLLELNDTVNVLEEDFKTVGKSKFGLSLDEIRKRRVWVVKCEGELKRMLDEVNEPLKSTLVHPLSKTYSNENEEEEDRNAKNGNEDDLEAYQQEQESIILHQQDQTLGTISGVVGVLREQASLMGRELFDQTQLRIIPQNLSKQTSF